MKFKYICPILYISFLMSCSQEPADLSLSVTPQTTAETPVGPLLYSHFIEIGFGYQIAPMQAELFFNRSFEFFPPYNGKSKNSFGFLLGDGKYITDWSGESWYHSGYEHNSWFAAPGDPGNPAIITDTSTFFLTNSAEMNVTIQPVVGGGIHGDQSLRIMNQEDTRWGGVAQEGKYLEKGKTYHFTGYLKSIKGNGEVQIRIYTEKDWSTPLLTKSITVNDTFRKYNYDFTWTGETGRNTFALFVASQSLVEADAFSLLPDDQFYHWRPAVVEVVKKLNPGLIRFPGGCFASFYNWKDGIGDYDGRKPEPSYFWGGLNNNDLGTNEFAMLCKATGAEMMLCVNIYTPGKRFYLNHQRNPWQSTVYELPQFTDPEKGVKNAADWVAYCNLNAGEHPMADLRAKQGFQEPFGVKYWEMDNETVRWYSATDYAKEVVKYSRAMKAIDPSIKIGMVTYDFTDQVPEMLEIAGDYIDFFADRDDAEDNRLSSMITLINNWNNSHGTHIKYCNTEWQVHPYGAPNPKEEVDPRYLYGHKTAIKRSMVLGTWYCGLKATGYLLDWQRRGDIVDFVNFNNFSNTHGQAVIESPKEGAYLTAPGKVYELLSRTPARWPLVCEGYQPKRTDMLQAQASWSLNRDTLVLTTLNRTDSTKSIEFDLSQLSIHPKTLQFTMLDADDIFARTKIDKPNEIRRTEWTEKARKKRIRVVCKPRSVIQVVIQ